ncbi:hypothetical protein DPV78_000030 [Talaromyces pinophilus]|nr:hypothetical protein DPV78_000030 [Talaromyces pinophilus]
MKVWEDFSPLDIHSRPLLFPFTLDNELRKGNYHSMSQKITIPPRLGKFSHLDIRLFLSLGMVHLLPPGFAETSSKHPSSDLVRKHCFYTLKVCVRGHQPDREIAISKYSKNLNDHFGKQLVRLVIDSLEVVGPHGKHACLLYQPLGMNLTEFQNLLPDNKFPKGLGYGGGQSSFLCEERSNGVTLGPPPPEFLIRSDKCLKYWDNQSMLFSSINWKGGIPIPEQSLEMRFGQYDGEDEELFLNVLRRILCWLPDERPTAEELAYDDFLMQPLLNARGSTSPA